MVSEELCSCTQLSWNCGLVVSVDVVVSMIHLILVALNNVFVTC